MFETDAADGVPIGLRKSYCHYIKFNWSDHLPISISITMPTSSDARIVESKDLDSRSGRDSRPNLKRITRSCIDLAYGSPATSLKTSIQADDFSGEYSVDERIIRKIERELKFEEVIGIKIMQFVPSIIFISMLLMYTAFAIVLYLLVVEDQI